MLHFPAIVFWAVIFWSCKFSAHLFSRIRVKIRLSVWLISGYAFRRHSHSPTLPKHICPHKMATVAIPLISTSSSPLVYSDYAGFTREWREITRFEVRANRLESCDRHTSIWDRPDSKDTSMIYYLCQGPHFRYTYIARNAITPSLMRAGRTNRRNALPLISIAAYMGWPKNGTFLRFLTSANTDQF